MTTLDHKRMREDGWCIEPRFSGYQLRHVAKGRFRDDQAAWLHVFDALLAGDALATAALEFLAAADPLEFRAIAHYVVIFRRQSMETFREARAA